jgi:hypothetical protein
MPIVDIRNQMIYRNVENSIYSASNSDRLLRDHKAWGDGNLVDVLGAYDFDSRLNSSLMELSGNLPPKKPDPYTINY